MKAFEVKDGVDAIFCETQEDVNLVIAEWKRRADAIGQSVNITVEEMDIRSLLASEQAYIQRLRKPED